MNKKVAIIVCAFPPQGGGLGNNAYYHLRELKKIGYEAKVFTPKYKDIKHISGDDVEYLPVVWPLGKAGFLFSLSSKLKGFDIIHLYYPFFGTDLIVLVFKVFHPHKKLVLHYQMDPVGYGYRKFIFKLYLKLFLPLLIIMSQKIIILSQDNAQHSYLRRSIKKYKHKFVVIPNGVDTSIFQPASKNWQLAEQYHISENDQVIVFAGGLDDQHFFKGVDVLLKSFALVSQKNDNAKLMLIGDGNKRNYYEKLAQNLNLQEKVVFTGWINNESLPDYYNLGDIFVLPSTEKTESFGIVIAEAQACGLPALVANWPGSRLTIEDNKTGFLVEPKNESDLSEKIIKLLNDDDLRKKMSQSGSLRAREKYSWDSVIIKIDFLYKDL